jgi:hypothetical protein
LIAFSGDLLREKASQVVAPLVCQVLNPAEVGFGLAQPPAALRERIISQGGHPPRLEDASHEGPQTHLFELFRRVREEIDVHARSDVAVQGRRPVDERLVGLHHDEEFEVGEQVAMPGSKRPEEDYLPDLGHRGELGEDPPHRFFESGGVRLATKTGDRVH